MPRNRTPSAVAKITGDTIKHPERHVDRADPPISPLGHPPEKLSEAEKEAWCDFADLMPWLGGSDRQIVWLASKLSVRTADPDCPIGVFAQLRLCLSSMGGTPVDRSRVQWEQDENEDPANEFLN